MSRRVVHHLNHHRNDQWTKEPTDFATCGFAFPHEKPRTRLVTAWAEVTCRLCLKKNERFGNMLPDLPPPAWCGKCDDWFRLCPCQEESEED